MSKHSGYKFGLVVAMLHLHLSLLSSLDLGLEGVQEAGKDGGTLQKYAEVDADQGNACRMRLSNQAV